MTGHDRRSPTDIQPVLDVVEKTPRGYVTHLTLLIYRVEGDALSRCAVYGPMPVAKPATYHSWHSRWLSDHRPPNIHVHDLAAELETEFPTLGPSTVPVLVLFSPRLASRGRSDRHSTSPH